MADDAFIWSVRTFIYQRFVESARAPQVEEIADHFRLTIAQAGEVLKTLHDKHALFLKPGTVAIRMANPFSAIPTPYQVDIGDKTYWANCAWDSFGIIAALHAPHASIRSICAHTGKDLHLAVSHDQVVSAGEVVHFLVPSRRWYDDLVRT